MRLAPTAARAIVALLLILPSPAAAQDADSTLAHRLAHALDSLATAGRFSGAVLLAHHDVPIFARAYGLADRERGLPNTLETAFNLASVGKLFTQTAIEQLGSAGALDRHRTVGSYWPEFPNHDVATRVTIDQLVTMTSGIGGEIFGTPETAHAIRTIPEYLAQFAGAPLQFEPGTRKAYSNAGYVVLGGIVERVSGEEYRTYLRRHVFEPAGMTRTGFYDSDSLPAFAAIGYTTGDEDVHDGPMHPNTGMLPGRGSPAGGSYSTVGDLLRYVHAQRTGSIAGVSGTPTGWAGGTAGANTFLVPDLPGDYTLVVLANVDPPVAMQVQTLVRGWLSGR